VFLIGDAEERESRWLLDGYIIFSEFVKSQNSNLPTILFLQTIFFLEIKIRYIRFKEVKPGLICSFVPKLMEDFFVNLFQLNRKTFAQGVLSARRFCQNGASERCQLRLDLVLSKIPYQ
jgi:hypothetical protein